MKWACFDNKSMIIRIAVFPLLRGRSIMKSMEIIAQGQEGISRGCNSPRTYPCSFPLNKLGMLIYWVFLITKIVLLVGCHNNVSRALPPLPAKSFSSRDFVSLVQTPIFSLSERLFTLGSLSCSRASFIPPLQYCEGFSKVTDCHSLPPIDPMQT